MNDDFDSVNNESERLKRLRDHAGILPRLASLLEDGATGELRLQAELRQEFPDDVVRSAFALHELRRRARAKFSRADRMWLTRRGLEQATSEIVACHKAGRFCDANTQSPRPIYDLCCGIGGDTLALAACGDVIAIDRSPTSCLLTEWNSDVYEVGDRVRVECRSAEQLGRCDGLLHVDPDRRTGRRGRSRRVEDYEPGLELLQEFMNEFPGGAIKVGPASNFGGKFPGAEIELVSVHGECKEAIVWFGTLAGDDEFRATVLPADATLSGDPLSVAVEITPPQRYVFDPDPAIVRAGLVDVAASQLGLSRLDEAEEYLTGSDPVDSPFVRAFEVLDVIGHHSKDVRRYFRGTGYGQLEIKCRHLPVDANRVRRQLTLTGDSAGVLIFARLAGRARALVCRRIAASDEN